MPRLIYTPQRKIFRPRRAAPFFPLLLRVVTLGGLHRRLSRLTVLVAILSMLLLGSGGWLFFFSDLFTLRVLEVGGNEFVPRRDIEEMARAVFSEPILRVVPQNLIFFNREALTKKLAAAFPRIREVSLATNLEAGRLTVAVRERKETGIWCLERPPAVAQERSDDEGAGVEKERAFPLEADCYFVDEEGIAFAPAPKSEGQLIPVFFSSAVPPGEILGTEVMKSALLEFSRVLRGLFMEKLSLPVNWMREEQNGGVRVRTSEGWDAILWGEGEQAPAAAVERLGIFLKEGIPSGDRLKLRYVDLRIENKVYYTTR